jgi:hypothetical protein
MRRYSLCAIPLKGCPDIFRVIVCKTRKIIPPQPCCKVRPARSPAPLPLSLSLSLSLSLPLSLSLSLSLSAPTCLLSRRSARPVLDQLIPTTKQYYCSRNQVQVCRLCVHV